MDAVDFIRVLSFCGKGQMEINLSEGLFCTGKPVSGILPVQDVWKLC